ncbi:hypothetical protein C3F00_039490, partial [Pseudomonas sp. MWU13-2860]
MGALCQAFGQAISIVDSRPARAWRDLNLDYRIQAQAERLKEWFATLNVRRVRLIGNSMGGTIAAHLAATMPHLVASLVLIDAAGFEASPSWLQQHMSQTGLNPMHEIRSADDYRAMM